MEKQVRSRERVAKHGEVMTGAREVNAMLDLVKQETERIDSRFLEPACGDGNFLTAILERKLVVVERRYGKAQLDFERYAVLAVSSIYGIDILQDNVLDCRRRLFDLFAAVYSGRFGKKTKDRCRAAVRFILEKNIIHGDALTLKTEGVNPSPIVFAQWSLVGGRFKRMDYAFHDLAHPEPGAAEGLFSGQNGIVENDLGGTGFIPQPVRTDYPPVHFLEIGESENESE